MGQQQLLLVILVTIIVGIATVVAINTFSAASDDANVQAARQDMLTIASNAQGWYMKPGMMGGGGNAFTGIEMQDICPGEATSTTECTTQNGTYTISGIGADEFKLTGTPASAGGTLTGFVIPDNIVETSGGTTAGITYTPPSSGT